MAVELDPDNNGAIDIALGGTNAKTAAGARANLGLSASVADYAAARALTGLSAGQIVFIAYRETIGDEGGGSFYFDASNQSVNVSSDTRSGKYLALNSDPSGTNGCLVRFGDALSPEMFGASQTATPSVNASAINAAIQISSGKTLIINSSLTVDQGLDFTGWSGTVTGNGQIVVSPGISVPLVLDFTGASDVYWSGVGLDMGQTNTTLTGDARSDSGFYIKDARDCFFSDFKITNIRVGEPIYVDGTSSVSPSDAHGSKRIFFERISCVAYEYNTVDIGAFVNVRSDFYTLDGGGIYISATNGLKQSDYTLDATVAHQRTTQDIFFTDCHFENFDRFALYNVKGVHLSNVSLKNFYTRGLTLSPSCENVTWDGGRVSGNSAQININYACRNVVISNLVAEGEAASAGQRHALRVGFGSQDVTFSNIVGLGNDFRQVFIEGAKNVSFDSVQLLNWSGGSTTVAVSIAGGGAGNTSSWITDGIRFSNCNFSANYAFKFDDNAGTATVASGGVVADEACIFSVGISFYNGTEPTGGQIRYHGRGTWAPRWIGTSVPGTNTFTSTGRYRRDGDVVYIEGTINLTVKDGAMAGNVEITTLPFTPIGGTDQNASIVVGYYSGLTFPAGFTQLAAFVGSTSRVQLRRLGSGVVGAPVNVSELAAGTFLFSGHYLAR